ncbi:MAG: segregation and condensation protein [Actinomycetota bacterium]|jgi:segregation and condensation protein B
MSEMEIEPITQEESEETVDGLAAPSLRAALEAILMVIDEPVKVEILAQITDTPVADVENELANIGYELEQKQSGFLLRQVAGGWRFYTNEECWPIVEKFVKEGQPTKLTQASLETLAVVAYKQPVSKGRISAIRGVNVDTVIRTLLNRGLIEEAGIEHESQSILYRTTSYFLEKLGINDLSDLPPVADYLPDMSALDSLIEDADR